MKKYFKNKIALVTGSSRGFGFAVALKLAQAGADLIITARTTGALEVLSDKILKYGGKVTVVPLDLKNQTHTQLFCKTIYERFGKIDLFIHSAFLAVPMAPIETISEKDMTKYFVSNTFLTQRLIKLIHPLLKIQKNSIAVFIHDNTKKNNKKFLGIHNAIQAASKEVVESYSQETSRTGPKVLMFEPLPMPTKTRNIMFPGEDKKKLSTCEEEANKLVKILISEISN
tara:strand:- start:221 stop:904 length:684 start_codon:yes stop_codon:yes gene_type:complete